MKPTPPYTWNPFKLNYLGLINKPAAALLLAGGLLATARADVTYTPALTNAWVLPAGVFSGLPSSSANNCRGIAIDPVTTNVLFFSSIGGTNGSTTYSVSTVAFANGSNFLGQLNAAGITSGTVGAAGIRVSDDGYVYACNVSGSPASNFKIYRWSSDTDITTAPTVVYNSGAGTSFQWRLGDYMDVRGSGTNTEIVVVGPGSGANVTTNFTIFRPTDATCTTFTNFSITIPGSTASINLCGAGVAFEGTNNAIWIRRTSSQETRHIVYDPGALTATCDRTNNLDQSVCQGLKYIGNTNGVKLLATVQATTSATSPNIARVFQIPASPTASLVSVLTANLPAPYAANGNALGTVDAQNGYIIFGAPGNGLTFFHLGFITTAPPTATVAASASTIIAGFAETLTATVSGSTPLSYQWYYNTNTLIASATTNAYTIPSIQPANAGVYTVIVTNLYGAVTNSVSVAVVRNGSSSLATQIWSLAPGSRTYLTTDDAQRGLAYDPVLQRVVLVSRTSGYGIYLLDAATGADEGQLDISALQAITPPGTYPVNACGVADDGAVYVGNLLTSATSDNFAIYRWSSADPSGTISQAYIGNPGVARIGDTMSVRGSGVNTEILCSFRSGTNVVLFNTTDGQNFNLNLIAITNLPASAQANGFAGLGLAFGTNNTFWAKSSGFDLRQVAYDLNSGYGWVIYDDPNVPTGEAAIGVDSANGYVATIAEGETPQSLPLYDLFAAGGPSQTNLVDREFFPANNANGNGTGAVAFDVGNGRIFALDSNNGLIAASYAGKIFTATAAGLPAVAWPVTNSVLQGSTNVAGPYTDIPGATSPYTGSTAKTQFYRLRH